MKRIFVRAGATLLAFLMLISVFACGNEGFLKARNNGDMKFYLMWANHDANYSWDRRISSCDERRTVIWKLIDKKKLTLKENGRFLTTHMARNWHKPHAELAEQLAPMGVTPAYDGMTVEV